jgi:uridine phosphorylase
MTMPPSRLRPTASFATDAILVGDPGRALLLAQELLEQPKMSNHARGLWGYTGITKTAGKALTLQSTGMGGPSAALVLSDLAKLGVRRAVRIGSCLVAGPGDAAGELLLVEKAVAAGGSAGAFDLAIGESASPDAELTERLRSALGDEARPATVASYDIHPSGTVRLDEGVGAADMQTVAILARAAALGIAAAAVLVGVDSTGGATLSGERREEAEKRAGRAVSKVLSTSS